MDARKSTEKTVQVVVRVRPPSSREVTNLSVDVVRTCTDKKSIAVHLDQEVKPYSFDFVAGQTVSQVTSSAEKLPGSFLLPAVFYLLL